MAKLLQTLLIASIAFALCAAEAPLRRNSRFRQAPVPQRSRFFARQEIAEEAPKAVTPYPSADELKPEIAFDDVEKAVGDVQPTNDDAEEEQAAPAINERKPDETYGPPEFELEAAAPRTPDETYGPPEFDAAPASDDEPIAADLPAVDAELPSVDEQQGNSVEESANDENADILPEPAQPARLTAAKRRVVNRARPAKLRAAPKLRIARIQQQPQQPIFFYAAQQQW